MGRQVAPHSPATALHNPSGGLLFLPQLGRAAACPAMQAGAASLRSRAPALLLPPPGVPNPRTGGLGGGGACKRLQAGVARAGTGARRPPSPPAAAAGASNAGPSAPAPSSIPSESNGSSPPPAFNWQQQWYPLVGVGSSAPRNHVCHRSCLGEQAVLCFLPGACVLPEPHQAAGGWSAGAPAGRLVRTAVAC